MPDAPMRYVNTVRETEINSINHLQIRLSSRLRLSAWKETFSSSYIISEPSTSVSSPILTASVADSNDRNYRSGRLQYCENHFFFPNFLNGVVKKVRSCGRPLGFHTQTKRISSHLLRKIILCQILKPILNRK